MNTGIAVPATTSFRFLDERPPEQRLSHPPAAYGEELLLGDDAIRPSIADTFKAVLAGRNDLQLAGRTVRITDAAVTVLDPAVTVEPELSHGFGVRSALPPPGAIEGSIIFGIKSVGSQKWVYARVRGFVDQNEFSAYDSRRFSGRVSEANIRTTILSAVELAADDAKRAASAH